MPRLLLGRSATFPSFAHFDNQSNFLRVFHDANLLSRTIFNRYQNLFIFLPCSALFKYFFFEAFNKLTNSGIFRKYTFRWRSLPSGIVWHFFYPPAEVFPRLFQVERRKNRVLTDVISGRWRVRSKNFNCYACLVRNFPFPHIFT